jgi:hypothetical protein
MISVLEHDLNTAAGLQAGLDDAGSWAELSRRTGIPVSTLKSRGNRLGVGFYADDDEEPILSREVLEEIEGWVRSNVHWLLHEAPMRLQEAVDGDTTPEMAETILCAKMSQRLVELVYKTHGVPLELLWEIERREEAKGRT